MAEIVVRTPEEAIEALRQDGPRRIVFAFTGVIALRVGRG